MMIMVLASFYNHFTLKLSSLRKKNIMKKIDRVFAETVCRTFTESKDIIHQKYFKPKLASELDQLFYKCDVLFSVIVKPICVSV